MVPFLRRYVPRAYAAFAARSRTGLPLREMSIALVNDARMSELHQEFMSIAGPTDVLTFPIDVDRHGRVTSGEIVISVPYARRIAKERKIELDREVLLYAVHGMLHLLGYDDRTASAYRTMHRTEDELLSKLGLGPVFASSQSGKGSSRRPSGGRKRRTR